MERIKKMSDVMMEHIVFQPGNATRYELLIGVFVEDETRKCHLQWLNRKGRPTVQAPLWDLFYPNYVAEVLGCSLGDAVPLTDLMNEYLAKHKAAKGET